MYKVKDKYQNYDSLITTVNGKAINLLGKPVKKIVPPKGNREPGYETQIPGATQAELEIAFKAGNSCIVEVTNEQAITEAADLGLIGAGDTDLTDPGDDPGNKNKGTRKSS